MPRQVDAFAGRSVKPRQPDLFQNQRPKYGMTQAVVAVKGAGMQADGQNIGRVGWIKGVHLFRGDTEHHYTVLFDNGRSDSVDESCLRT